MTSKFWDTFETKLCDLVKDTPEDFKYQLEAAADPAAFAKKVRTRMETTGFKGCNHDGKAMQRTCRALGIKGTRQAITAYLANEEA